MKIALEPCPFCGGEADIIIEPDKVLAECRQCGARSGWYGYTLDNRKRSFESVMNAARCAMDRWNDRKKEE